jgi:hypothetical protein
MSGEKDEVCNFTTHFIQMYFASGMGHISTAASKLLPANSDRFIQGLGIIRLANAVLPGPAVMFPGGLTIFCRGSAVASLLKEKTSEMIKTLA